MTNANVIKQPQQKTSVPTRLFDRVPLLEGSLFDVNPFVLMRRFTEDMDQMLGPLSKEAQQISGWRPAIEMKEEKGKFLVKADLPGVEMKDVKVSVTNNILTVEGERKHEVKEKSDGFFHSERSYGRFFRSIQLPEGAKTDKASAQFMNGVLEITLPVPEIQQKRLEIPVHEAPHTKTVVG